MVENSTAHLRQAKKQFSDTLAITFQRTDEWLNLQHPSCSTPIDWILDMSIRFPAGPTPATFSLQVDMVISQAFLSMLHFFHMTVL